MSSCLNPIFVEKKRSILGSKHVSERLQKIYNNKSLVSSYAGSFVPCGRCAACLKRRQQDLAARCSAAASYYGSMIFVTLTYNDANIPLSCVIEQVDKDTGEVFQYSSLYQLRRRFRNQKEDEFLDEVLRGVCASRSHSYRYTIKDLVEIEGTLFRMVVTPSLYTRDVRLWLKRSRVAYEREYGSKLPDFKYVICGEYGNHNSKRPHYHLAFFGLDKSYVDYLVSLWNFGFTYVQKVNAVNSDGTDGFALAAKYIGKYMSKGKFDCQSVEDGFAFKSRICSSKYLAGELSPALVSYFKCEDLIGEYDIETPLSSEKLSILLSELPKRSSVRIGSSFFVLPNVYKRQLWYVKDSDKVFRSSVVRMQIADALSVDPVVEYRKQLLQDNPNLSYGEVLSLVAKFQTEQMALAKLTNERQMLILQQFYLTSNF